MTPVLVDDRDEVRIITLSRPHARNAMDSALLAALLEVLVAAVGDERVRVLVITGAGGAFSAGADLREELDHAGQVRRMDLFYQVYQAVGTCPIPTLAAVAGPCVGGGAEVAAACDLRVVDPTATFRFPGAALGIPVGPAKLVGLVGLGTAKDLVLTSRTVDASEAVRIGLAQRMAAPGEALTEAADVARAIAANHPATVVQQKRQFDHFSGLSERIAIENDALRAAAEGAVTSPDG